MKFALIISLFMLSILGSTGIEGAFADDCCAQDTQEASTQSALSDEHGQEQEEDCCDQTDCCLCHSQSQAVANLTNSLAPTSETTLIAPPQILPESVFLSGFFRPPIS